MEYSHGLPPVPGETIPPDPPLMTSQTQIYLIDTLERHKAQTEIGLQHLLRRRKRFLALGLPILLIILIIAPEFINLIWAILDPSPNYLVLTLQRYTYITLQFCIVTVAAIFYYVAIGSKIIVTKGALKSLGESLYLKRFATYEGRMLLLRKELARLMNKTAQVFFENQERYEQAVKWHKETGYTLDRLEKAGDVKIDMRSANTAGETKTVSMNEVQLLLGSINELILREDREQQEQRVWQYMALLIMVLYIMSLAAAQILMARRSLNNAS